MSTNRAALSSLSCGVFGPRVTGLPGYTARADKGNPARDLWRRAWQQLRDGMRRRALWPLVRDTVSGLPWALAHRHVLPPSVREMLRSVNR